MALTQQQEQQVLQARPDVASEKYYSQNVGEWWDKYGQKEMPGLFSQPQTTLSTSPALQQPSYTFDPNQYLPQIQQTAEAIYGPQKAQLEALRKLGEQKAEQAKVKTKEDFANRLRAEEEAINRRGAFFSGGALEAKNRTLQEQSQALSNIDLQSQADAAQMLAQQGLLSAQQADEIQQRLYSAESGAYGRYRDEMSDYMKNRDFEFQKATDERNYLRSVFESDRSFKQNVKEFEKQYKLSKEQAQLAKDRFEEDKEQYDEEMAYKLMQASLKGTSSGKSGLDLEKYTDYDPITETTRTRWRDKKTNEIYEVDDGEFVSAKRNAGTQPTGSTGSNFTGNPYFTKNNIFE